MSVRFAPSVLMFPNGGTTVVPTSESRGDEALVQFLHSDSGFFRGDGLRLLENILGGVTEGAAITGNRTVLTIQRAATTITDAYADPETGFGFPILVIDTSELRDNLVAWHQAEDNAP